MSSDTNGAAERMTPSAVAYDLMRDIMFEDPIRPPPSSREFRTYLLDLYAECLLAVRGKRALMQPRGGVPVAALGGGPRVVRG